MVDNELMRKFKPQIPAYAFSSIENNGRISYTIDDHAKKELKKVALAYGWVPLSMLTLCLDQFCQFYLKHPYSITRSKDRANRMRQTSADEKERTVLALPLNL